MPVIEAADGGVTVKVGSNPHPMEEKHYIEWIEILDGDDCCRHFLKPGEAPETFFATKNPNVTAREYCNVHGLWKS
ncbi:MAG: desulfoferrodoxin family protein [Desulfotignum sp.]